MLGTQLPSRRHSVEKQRKAEGEIESPRDPQDMQPIALYLNREVIRDLATGAPLLPACPQDFSKAPKSGSRMFRATSRTTCPTRRPGFVNITGDWRLDHVVA